MTVDGDTAKDMQRYERDGVLLVDKPKGPTSFDVIRHLRRVLGIRKMGHSGTLDPAASGLLLVAYGAGTKRLASLIKLPKTYEARILFGVRTASGDLEGEVLEQESVGDIPREHVEAALAGMVGELALRVPLYSAVKLMGKPLYAYARGGTSGHVEAPVKRMVVRSARLRAIVCEDDKIIADVVFDVESGTYIRSLAEELGRRLSLPATLRDLRRIVVGPYNVEDAYRVEWRPRVALVERDHSGYNTDTGDL